MRPLRARADDDVMNSESSVSVVTTVAVFAALAVSAYVAFGPGPNRHRRLRWATFWLTTAVSVALAPYTVADSGVAASYLLGVPVIAAALPVLADRRGVARTAADAVGALVMSGWGLLLGLGIGVAFLPGALLLIAGVIIDLLPSRRSAA